MAALVLGSADEDLRVQLGEVFDRAGLVCERTDDVTGVEMAGRRQERRRAPAAAAEPHGMNAAGIAAAGIWDECIDYTLAKGGGSRRSRGLAGVGDLMATILAPNSRNRRAGELSARASPPIRSRAGSGRRRRGLTRCR